MTAVARTRRRACFTAWHHHVALWVAIAVNCALAACGGGGTDTRPTTAPTGPVVGAPQTTDGRHCPDRTIPVPPGGDFSGYNVEHTDYTGVNLRGANFDGATLNALVLSGDLTGTTFRGAHITGVLFAADSTLDNANFEGAVFVNVAGNGTVFAGPKLVDTCFVGATFQPDHSVDPPRFPNPLIRVDFSYSDILRADDGTSGAGIDHALALPGSQGNMFRGVKVPCSYLKTAYAVSMDISDFVQTDDFWACATAYANKDMSNFAFDGLDLRDFDLEGTNLAGATFNGAVLGSRDPGFVSEPIGSDLGQHFNLANYSGATFVNAWLGKSYADYQGVDFSRSNFNNVKIRGHFENARFDGSTMTNVVFYDAEFSGTRFTGATLTAVTFATSNFDPTTDFTSARVTGAGDPTTPDFAVTLDGVKFDQAVLSAINFGGTSMVGASFQHTTFASSTIFTDAAGHTANAAGAHFENAIADGADFRGLQATGAHFDSASLGGSRWDRAVLDGVSFKNATLDGATGMSGALTGYSGINFNLASVRGVDFSGSKLYSADFSSADLEAANFTGASLIADPDNAQGVAAKFDNAHLQNVSFANATLNSVTFSKASLYSSVQAATCQLASKTCSSDAPRTGGTCSCATVSGANLTKTAFDQAFLYGVDFSTASTIVNATTFNGAILVNTNFRSATFRIDAEGGGKAARFNDAWLQGSYLGTADFNGSSLSGAFVDFGAKNAQGDLRAGNALYMQLTAGYTGFRNWSGSKAGVCLKLEWKDATVLPQNLGNAECPNGETVSSSTGCGPQAPYAPGVTPNPRWFSTSVKNGSPVASYEKQSTYEPASSPSCTRGPDDALWFQTHYAN